MQAQLLSVVFLGKSEKMHFMPFRDFVEQQD